MFHKNFIQDCNKERGVLYISKSYFEKDCLLHVAGMYTNKYFVSILPYGDSEVEIAISHKNKNDITDKTLKQFMNDLIDQQIRLDLQKKFGDIRKTIVMYAFSPAEKSRA